MAKFSSSTRGICTRYVGEREYSRGWRFFPAKFARSFAFKPRASLPSSHLLCSIPGPDLLVSLAGRQHSLLDHRVVLLTRGDNLWPEDAQGARSAAGMLAHAQEHLTFDALAAPITFLRSPLAALLLPPVDSRCTGHPCCRCAGSSRARAAVAATTVRSSSHSAIQRQQTSTNSSARIFFASGGQGLAEKCSCGCAGGGDECSLLHVFSGPPLGVVSVTGVEIYIIFFIAEMKRSRRADHSGHGPFSFIARF